MGKQRKFVFVLGAGASLGAGAVARVQAGGQVPIPTQASFWPTLLRFCGPTARSEIEHFLFRYFLGYERVPAKLNASERAKKLAGVDVEEVFTFLSERARAPSTASQAKVVMNRVWGTLVQAVGEVFRRFPANAATRSTYDRLRTNQIRARDAVISFNYDTVFESSLIKGIRWAYAGIENTAQALPVFKPHGSINWTMRTDSRIVRGKAVVARPIIIAPTHLKFVSYTNSGGGEVPVPMDEVIGYLDQARDIQTVWAQMEEQMRAARALVFIGYSFPSADLYFSSVLRSVLASRGANPDVVVVNPDAIAIAERLQRRFAIESIVKYFDLQQYSSASRKDVIRQLEQ